MPSKKNMQAPEKKAKKAANKLGGQSGKAAKALMGRKAQIEKAVNGY